MAAESAILVLNHFADAHLIALYDEIARECGAEHDVVLLSDRTRPSLSLRRRDERPEELRFTIDDLLRLGYPGKQDIALPGREQRSLKLGNAELPVLLFHKTRAKYSYYWIVEYDVRFSGSWRTFFSAFRDNDADLLGTTLTRKPECPGWSHWPSLSLSGSPPADEDCLRGFFPVYRVSNHALLQLDEAYKRGSAGHMETLLPTVLNRAGCRIEDIGGEGEFVRAGNENRFYRNQRVTNDLSPGTFVYRPVHTEVGDEPDKLWHPVKPAASLSVRVANKLLREFSAST